MLNIARLATLVAKVCIKPKKFYLVHQAVFLHERVGNWHKTISQKVFVSAQCHRLMMYTVKDHLSHVTSVCTSNIYCGIVGVVHWHFNLCLPAMPLTLAVVAPT